MFCRVSVATVYKSSLYRENVNLKKNTRVRVRAGVVKVQHSKKITFTYNLKH